MNRHGEKLMEERTNKMALFEPMDASLSQIQDALPQGRQYLSGTSPLYRGRPDVLASPEALEKELQRRLQTMREVTGEDVQIHDVSHVSTNYPYAFSVPVGTDVNEVIHKLYPPCPNKFDLHAGDDDPEFQAKVARRQAWLKKQAQQ
jgi:hypothetical protein